MGEMVSPVESITVNVRTANFPGADGRGRLFLGIGGREFRLALPESPDSFGADSLKTFVLGQSDPEIPTSQGNVMNPEFNDPRTHYNMNEDDVDRFPKYLRFEPSAPASSVGGLWALAYSGLLVRLTDDRILRYEALRNPQGGANFLWIGDLTSSYVYFRPNPYIRSTDQIREIRAIIHTRSGASAGTDSDVWLGIGGREFDLDRPGIGDFEPGPPNEFVLGNVDSNAQGNIENAFHNDPRFPYHMTVKSLDIFPTYLRFHPSHDDFWEAEDIEVIVRTLEGHTIRYEALKPLSADYPNWIRLWPGSGQFLFLRKIKPEQILEE